MDTMQIMTTAELNAALADAWNVPWEDTAEHARLMAVWHALKKEYAEQISA